MPQTSSDLHHDEIAVRAHEIASRDGGTDIDNWLKAERELTEERESGKPAGTTTKRATSAAARPRKPKAKPAETD
jgi:Protein of unknown function (DUF2934)